MAESRFGNNAERSGGAAEYQVEEARYLGSSVLAMPDMGEVAGTGVNDQNHTDTSAGTETGLADPPGVGTAMTSSAESDHHEHVVLTDAFGRSYSLTAQEYETLIQTVVRRGRERLRQLSSDDFAIAASSRHSLYSVSGDTAAGQLHSG